MEDKNKEEQKKEDYQNLVDNLKPKNKVVQNTIRAFIVGGAICIFAEIIYTFFIKNGVEKEMAQSYVTLTFIFLGVLLTGLGIYEKLGKYAGAGSIVPISGFANSIASPAIEYKKEGLVSGVGAKMFTVSGPVIVYGVFTSIVCGLIHFVMRCL